VEATVEQFRYPTSPNAVIDLVKQNKKIRCSGALHSCAPLIESQGIILSLTKLDRIISIDTERRIVRMEAGVRMHDLCTYLSDYGLAVGTLGTIDWQTICGAVMTGTHGGGLTIPSLHDFVRSYTLVLPNGALKKVEKETSPTLFRAMAPSMGLFGAVVEMEMAVVPLEILEARLFVVPMDDVIHCFDSLMKTNKYARVVVYPTIKKATIWTANPVASREAAVANGATNNVGYANFRNDEEKVMLESFLDLCNENEFEQADEVLERVLVSQISRLNHYVGQYNHVLCLERNNGIPHADIEMNFSYDKYKEVLQTVFDYYKTNRLPYYNFEIRTTNQDDAFLSCCQSRRAMWIDFQAKASISKNFFEEMTSLLKQYGYRKHWAKGMDNSDPRYIVDQFPDIAKFIEAVKLIDPMGKFRNDEGESWFKALDRLTAGDCTTNATEGSKILIKETVSTIG